MTAAPLRFHWVLYLAILLIPGSALAQDANPRSSPFEQVEWVNDEPEVMVRSEWYQPLKIQGVDVKAILDFCRKEWPSRMKKRFGEDLPAAMEKMGHPLPAKVDLVLVRVSDGQQVELTGVEMSVANRMAIWQANQRRGGNRGVNLQPQRNPGRLSREMALADIAQFQASLDDQFAYRDLRGVDLDAELDAVRAGLGEVITPADLADRLNVVLAKFGDGHAGVNTPMTRRPSRYPPFLLQDAEGGVVAFKPDRSGFVDAERPYIVAIDGVPIDDWLETIRPGITQGSPQLVRMRSLRSMRDIERLRAQRGMPASDSLRCTLATGPSDPEPVEVDLPMTTRRPIYGSWPRNTTSTILDGTIGYLRLDEMSDEMVPRIRSAMPAFRDTDALVVDVRGNGGGSRKALIALAGYLQGPDENPWVGNVAKYRLSERFDRDHLDARYMYRADDLRWNDAQRAAIADFAEGFEPEWEPGDGFSAWHYLVLGRTGADGEYFYDKPVIILSDPVCFSATDIFLGAFADRPRITLVGGASGGGSARTKGFRLRNSGAEVRCASMASFRPDGRTYDGRGIEVDVEVEPAPGDVLQGGGDRVLEAAIKLIGSEPAPGN